MRAEKVWPDWMKRREGDPVDELPPARTRDVETTEPRLRRLYGPTGEVLRTFSDRPPVGFHQGEREPYTR